MIWLPVVGDYVDVDAYASIIAYTDLLNQRGKNAKTYIPIKPNYSVPKELRLTKYENPDFILQPDDQAIILDVSVPEAINRLIPDNQILEIVDHHPGYEFYWRERIGDKAIIDPIGAVATSIFEWWGKCWDYHKMSPQIAKLLLAAILDNTLNFNAEITTQRDHLAAAKLAEIAQVKLGDFTAWYFSTVSRTVLTDLKTSILQDSKVKFSTLFAQITLWDAKAILNRQAEIQEILSSKSSFWVINVICISERRNYILASNQQLAEYLTKLLNLKTDNSWLVSNQLYLRKEILDKIAQSATPLH